MPKTKRLSAFFAGLSRWTGRVLAVGSLLLLVVGSLRVRDSVRREERFFLDNWRLELPDLPDWVTPEIREELGKVDLGGSARETSLLEPGVLDRVRAAVGRSSWVEDVRFLGLAYPSGERPGYLRLEYRLRRPVAIVEQGGLYYLANSAGRRLGKPYGAPPTEWFGVPAITGIADPGPLPEEGGLWVSRDVLQGLEVARVLAEHNIAHDFPRQPIQAIDLANLHGRASPGESEIVLWCGGQRLAWGRSPISAGARTVPIPQLVANLRFVLSHPESFGGLALIHLHREPEVLTGVRG